MRLWDKWIAIREASRSVSAIQAFNIQVGFSLQAALKLTCNLPALMLIVIRFQCKVCQKSKESSPFYYSKKELTFTERAQTARRLNSVTAKLRCRECSGDPPDGIWCTHCEMIKPRDYFSQAARNRPAEAWCRPCVLWQESVEATTGDNYELALPVPSFVVAKEADRTYAPETADEKEARLAKVDVIYSIEV